MFIDSQKLLIEIHRCCC